MKKNDENLNLKIGFPYFRKESGKGGLKRNACPF
jgi:hypothetical protein